MSIILYETNKSAYQYCEAIQNRIHQIVEPLSELGITYFGHIKIFNDGSFFIISNDLDFLRDNFFKDGGFGNIFTEAYLNTKSKRYFLASSDNINIKKDRTIEISSHHNIFNAFNIYTIDKGHLSGYFFSARNQDAIISSSLYLNNIQLLEHFINYFNERAQDLIDVTDKTKIAKFDIDHHFNFYNKESTIENQKIQKFLQETQLKSFHLKTKHGEVSLSKRQTECLHYLSLGKSNKEIGRTLSLSPKTIEFYISNLKQKSGYHSRAELIREYSKNYLLLV
jgi:DNA-binding CsgD family transcriptional regulator